jgi:uncharacterized SAM-dependent methyltransferase
MPEIEQKVDGDVASPEDVVAKQEAEMLRIFCSDVDRGLSASVKKLSSLYFYDDEGSRIYAQITECEDYYLTRVEFELLNTLSNQKAISQLMARQGTGNGFNVVELGAGDGRKTLPLLRHFLDEKMNFSYNPIDISSGALESLEQKMSEVFTLQREGEKLEPADGKAVLNFQSLHGFNLEQMAKLKAKDQARLAAANQQGSRTNCVLFMGSSIGNMGPEDAVSFLRGVQDSLQDGDVLCIGFDLRKDPQQMINAYSDRDGLTAEFNYNLLRRMNSDLGANFIVKDFKHHAAYCPATSEMQSWLVSQKAQDVQVKALNKSFHFEQWECMQTESSFKYTERMIEEFAKKAGFELHQHLYDSKKWYVFSLWTVKK